MPDGTPARVRDLFKVGHIRLLPVRLWVAGRRRAVVPGLVLFSPDGSVEDRTAFALVGGSEAGTGRTGCPAEEGR
ncbi:hypothetical protein [Streptomyces sp. NPDC029674]|uniref:hypothetical protein n=1 Tax=Streptomyces sp. NPDC029674 TaxID=3365297 RepID=UPI00384C2B9F